MEYAEFEAEYQQVVLMLRGDRSGLPAAIERLRESAASIEDEDDREEAGWEIVALEDALAQGPGEPPTEVVLQMREAFAEADSNEGTLAERLARAEEGIRALERISANATVDEKREIGALSHTLHMLAGALRLELR